MGVSVTVAVCDAVRVWLELALGLGVKVTLGDRVSDGVADALGVMVELEVVVCEPDGVRAWDCVGVRLGVLERVDDCD